MNTLNPLQKKFVESDSSKIILSACPGSGKTHALAHRIKRDVESYGGGGIVCITFTEAGAKAFKERLSDMGVEISFAGTMHSYALQILNQHGHSLGYRGEVKQVPDDEVIPMIKEIMTNVGAGKDSPNKIFNIIAGNIESVTTLHFTVAKRVMSTLRAKGLATFDMMLADMLRLAPQLPTIEGLYLDESQDFSEVEWRIIDEILAGRKIIVGDEDQCIYEWRGADPTTLTSMKGDRMVLTENYRSTPQIISLANSVIKNNENRTKKEMVSSRQGGVDDSGVRYLHCFDTSTICLTIAKAAKSCKSIAVLCRYNSSFARHVTPNDLKNHFMLDPEGINITATDEEPDPDFHIGTIHSAKGLEWDTVIIIDWNPRVVTEEERRLFYVAITRAKNKVIVLGEEMSELAKEAGL